MEAVGAGDGSPVFRRPSRRGILFAPSSIGKYHVREQTVSAGACSGARWGSHP